MNENYPEMFEKLAAPFNPEDLEWRAGATNAEKTKALALAYITSRAVMDRLDEVVGPQNWRDEYAPGPVGGLVCGISLRINGDWITKWDGADNTQFEAVKGGLSDAFKRAAVKWGIGRYLYRLPNVWVPCEARGNTVVLKANPGLPPWALPEIASSDNGGKSSFKEREKEIMQELGFEHKPKSKGNGRRLSWRLEVVHALMDAGIASSPIDAVGRLNRSALKPDVSPEEAVAWFKEHHQA
jgi:hypothetical protein